VNFLKILFLTQALWAQRKFISIDGSSTVFPLTEAVAEEFQTLHRGKYQVTVGISGTGGGFKKFCRGQTDIQNASRPITELERETCRAKGISYVELPVAYDALAVIVNKKNEWVKEISTEALKKIWEPDAQGKVKLWSDVDSSWPATPIHLYAPGSDSGTFDYFTEAIVGKAKSSRGDFTASEDDNTIVQGVSRDTGALGYLGFAYYQSNQDKLKALPIRAKGAKHAIAPSFESILFGSYSPLSRPIFIYVNLNSLIQKEHVDIFTRFYLDQAKVLAKEIQYVPLSDQLYDSIRVRLIKRQIGTNFKNPTYHIKKISLESLVQNEPEL
jgi:phosphate transport system substrate-binding protein